MVAAHTSPLAVAAWRLGPAGLLLVAWGASKGRPQPSGTAAWLSILAFGIVDAACFQVGNNASAPRAIQQSHNLDSSIGDAACFQVSNKACVQAAFWELLDPGAAPQPSRTAAWPPTCSVWISGQPAKEARAS